MKKQRILAGLLAGMLVFSNCAPTWAGDDFATVSDKEGLTVTAAEALNDAEGNGDTTNLNEGSDPVAPASAETIGGGVDATGGEGASGGDMATPTGEKNPPAEGESGMATDGDGAAPGEENMASGGDTADGTTAAPGGADALVEGLVDDSASAGETLEADAPMGEEATDDADGEDEIVFSAAGIAPEEEAILEAANSQGNYNIFFRGPYSNTEIFAGDSRTFTAFVNDQRGEVNLEGSSLRLEWKVYLDNDEGSVINLSDNNYGLSGSIEGTTFTVRTSYNTSDEISFGVQVSLYEGDNQTPEASFQSGGWHVVKEHYEMVCDPPETLNTFLLAGRSFDITPKTVYRKLVETNGQLVEGERVEKKSTDEDANKWGYVVAFDPQVMSVTVADTNVDTIPYPDNGGNNWFDESNGIDNDRNSLDSKYIIPLGSTLTVKRLTNDRNTNSNLTIWSVHYFQHGDNGTYWDTMASSNWWVGAPNVSINPETRQAYYSEGAEVQRISLFGVNGLEPFLGEGALTCSFGIASQNNKGEWSIDPSLGDPDFIQFDNKDGYIILHSNNTLKNLLENAENGSIWVSLTLSAYNYEIEKCLPLLEIRQAVSGDQYNSPVGDRDHIFVGQSMRFEKVFFQSNVLQWNADGQDKRYITGTVPGNPSNGELAITQVTIDNLRWNETTNQFDIDNSINVAEIKSAESPGAGFDLFGKTEGAVDVHYTHKQAGNDGDVTETIRVFVVRASEEAIPSYPNGSQTILPNQTAEVFFTVKREYVDDKDQYHKEIVDDYEVALPEKDSGQAMYDTTYLEVSIANKGGLQMSRTRRLKLLTRMVIR